MQLFIFPVDNPCLLIWAISGLIALENDSGLYIIKFPYLLKIHHCSFEVSPPACSDILELLFQYPELEGVFKKFAI